MEISDLTGAFASRSTVARLSERAELTTASKQPSAVDDDRGRALDAFRNEIRARLRARFSARFNAGATAYSENRAPASANDVAKDVVDAARQSIAAQPTRASSAITAFRASVQDIATTVRSSFSGRDDATDVSDALTRADQGLADLGDEFGNVRESSASVLSVDTRTSERSTIKIRTQEGDIVRLDLRRLDTLTAQDAEASVPGGYARTTEIEAGSQTRLRLRVEGDINDDELNAIRSVIEQASNVADEFFGGDLASAFESSAALNFDSDQLARVKLRFRFTESTRVAFASQVERTAPEAVAATPAPVLPSIESVRAAPLPRIEPFVNTAPRLSPETAEQAQPTVQPVAESQPVEVENPVVAQTQVEPAVETDTTAPAGQPNFIEQFLDQVGDFLRSINEGFAGFEESGSVRFQYSESVKLTLLRETLSVATPVAYASAGETAEDILSALTEVSSASPDVQPKSAVS